MPPFPTELVEELVGGTHPTKDLLEHVDRGDRSLELADRHQSPGNTLALRLSREQMVQSYFHAVRFANCVEHPEKIRHFLDSSNITRPWPYTKSPMSPCSPSFPAGRGIEPELMSQIELGSWRYNCSSPTHNPGSYDLWIEIRTEQTNIVIGNW